MNDIHLQATIARKVQCSGVGIHAGKMVRVAINPAPVNHGIQFMRTDLPDCPRIAARFNKVVDSSMATVIGENGIIVSTIEHLMAAFTGLGIDNALVEINSHEMPIMDGSAGPFTSLLRHAGIHSQGSPRCYLVVDKPIELKADGKFVGIYPASHFKITCRIEFRHPLIEVQEYSTTITRDNFEKQIAQARTFGFLHEKEYLKKYGLGKGASIDNAIVIDNDALLNEDGLRYPDEFVRHKLLDCMGDFALLGLPIMGYIVCHRSGHSFHHAFIKKLFRQKDAWRTKYFSHESSWDNASAKKLAH